jgi:hypothetical protein
VEESSGLLIAVGRALDAGRSSESFAVAAVRWRLSSAEAANGVQDEGEGSRRSSRAVESSTALSDGLWPATEGSRHSVPWPRPLVPQMSARTTTNQGPEVVKGVDGDSYVAADVGTRRRREHRRRDATSPCRAPAVAIFVVVTMRPSPCHALLSVKLCLPCVLILN